jgi:hypothetical protein
MQIRVDVTQVPPVVRLTEPEDFSAFSVVVVAPPHAWVDPAALAELGGRSGDAAWADKLAGMISFAGSQGWLDAAGRIRAHVDLQRDGT